MKHRRNNRDTNRNKYEPLLPECVEAFFGIINWFSDKYRKGVVILPHGHSYTFKHSHMEPEFNPRETGGDLCVCLVDTANTRLVRIGYPDELVPEDVQETLHAVQDRELWLSFARQFPERQHAQ